MSRRHISQREAHELRAQVKALQDERTALFKRFGSDHPSIHIATRRVEDTLAAKTSTAQLLGHVVIVRTYGDELHFYALDSSDER